jgi:4-amino-4-deoxy-L-arabinose transferase-like glycosyltransferase
MGEMDSTAPAPSQLPRLDTGQLIVFALLAVALLWRVVFFLEMYASPYADNLTLDSQVYHEVALAAAAGEWSHGETFFQAPLYPWVLGVVYSLAGPSQTVVKLLQILLSVASCWLIFRVADRTFDRTVALVALAISAVYGMSLYFANELLVVTVIVFLDLLGLDLLLRAAAADRKFLWAAAGVVFGLSAIARPTILPFVAVVGVWIVVTGWRSGRVRTALREAVLFGVGVALPIAPVSLHNYIADGDLVLVAANGGVNFFIGNNPQSDGVTAVVPGTRADRWGGHADQVRIAREALGDPGATPREISDYWYNSAWSYIRVSPVEAFRHTAFKAFILINAHEVSNNRVVEFVTRHSSIYSWATLKIWLVLPLALAGFVVGRGRRQPKSLLLIFAVVYSATVIPFFINARFRMPLAAVLIIFAAAAVVAWCNWLRSRPFDRQAGQLVVVSVVVAVVVAILARPLPALGVPDAQAFFNEGEAYRAHGDFAAATGWYQAALDEYPGYCDAAFNLAQIHARVFPDPKKVVEVLEPVDESCAEDVGIRRLLGLSLCAVGRCDEGVEHLRFVAIWSPGSGEARRELERALSQD